MCGEEETSALVQSYPGKGWALGSAVLRIFLAVRQQPVEQIVREHCKPGRNYYSAMIVV